MEEYYPSRTELAQLFDWTLPTVDYNIRHHGLPIYKKGSRGKPHQFRLPDVIAWYAQHIAKQSVTTEGTAQELRRRKLAADTASAELDLAVKRGELGYIADIERAQISEAIEIKHAVMAVPARAAPLVDGADAATIRIEFERALNEALSEIAVAEPALDGIEKDIQSQEKGAKAAA